MKRSKAPVVATLVIVLLAGAAVVLHRATDENSPGEFQPYASTNDPKSGTNTGTASTNGHAPENETAKPKAPSVDETLNRRGPMGAEAEKRRIVNRRPRLAEAPGAVKKDKEVGTLKKQDIRKGIVAVRPLVKVCYEDSLTEFPEAAGKVTIGFRIIGEHGKGRVEMTELDPEQTTLFDKKLHDCLQARISEAEFAVPSGGAVNVRYPFVFNTGEQE